MIKPSGNPLDPSGPLVVLFERPCGVGAVPMSARARMTSKYVGFESAGVEERHGRRRSLQESSCRNLKSILKST